MADLLSVEDARRSVLEAVRPLPAHDVALGDALDRVLARPVTGATAVPPFDNSAMDGFAIRAGAAGRTLRIAGESRAGHPAQVAVTEADAVRISTGAHVPDGADAVIMVERTSEQDDHVTLEADTVGGQNIRRAGEDMAAGAEVLRAGTRLGPAELGVAANAGAAVVHCAQRPRVAIITTGDELVAHGAPLGPGQIHDSNGITLAGLAARTGAEVVSVAHADDELAATETVIAAALRTADVLILAGGVSVGPHDHVKPALAACGVQERFWRVALRPGKPTWFGTRDATLVFGLPGNPVSAVVTFLLFARPALIALQGGDPSIPSVTARLDTAVRRTPGRDELIRVTLRDGAATPTGPQGSHVLTSMLGADGLARVPAGAGELPAGTVVAVELLPR